MHPFFWIALLLAAVPAACTPNAAVPEQDAPGGRYATTSPYPAPAVTTMRAGGAVLMTVTFRSEEGVPVSGAYPVLLRIDGKVVAADLSRGPARSVEAGGTVVDQAVYRLPVEAARRLQRTPPDAVTVEVHDGTHYWAYPYRAGDLLEGR